jgi:hypothetical protein
MIATVPGGALVEIPHQTVPRLIEPEPLRVEEFSSERRDP